jgi:hypothetical protein
MTRRPLDAKTYCCARCETRRKAALFGFLRRGAIRDPYCRPCRSQLEMARQRRNGRMRPDTFVHPLLAPRVHAP